MEINFTFKDDAERTLFLDVFQEEDENKTLDELEASVKQQLLSSLIRIFVITSAQNKKARPQDARANIQQILGL